MDVDLFLQEIDERQEDRPVEPVLVEVVLTGPFQFVRVVIVIEVQPNPTVETEIVGAAAVQI